MELHHYAAEKNMGYRSEALAQNAEQHRRLSGDGIAYRKLKPLRKAWCILYHSVIGCRLL